MSRRAGSRSSGTNPRAMMTNPRAVGTNPRTVRRGATTSAGVEADARYARRIIGRALTRQRALGDGCNRCGGRATYSPWTCSCSPVTFTEAVEYLAAGGAV